VSEKKNGRKSISEENLLDALVGKTTKKSFDAKKKPKKKNRR